MTILRLRCLASAALILTCASAQAPPIAQQITSHLTANDLMADVSFLASDLLQGRGTPSPGLEIAGEYIAAQFRRAGLEPAAKNGYFQTAAFASVKPNLEGLELTLEIGVAFGARGVECDSRAGIETIGRGSRRLGRADARAGARQGPGGPTA